MGQKIHCRCGAVVPARDINLDRMMAKCARCDRVFEIELPDAQADGLRIPKPDKLLIERTGDALHLTHRWFQAAAHVPTALFAVAWMAFLVGWYAMANSLIFMIFPILHVAVGLGMSWYAVRGIFNRTEVSVTPHLIKAAVGPIFPCKAAQFPREDVTGIFVRENPSRFAGMAPNSTNTPRETFAVWVQLTGDREACLAAVVPSKPAALFIEQEIEAELGLTPQRVPGAVDVPEGLRRRLPKVLDRGALAMSDPRSSRGALSDDESR